MRKYLKMENIVAAVIGVFLVYLLYSSILK